MGTLVSVLLCFIWFVHLCDIFLEKILQSMEREVKTCWKKKKNSNFGSSKKCLTAVLQFLEQKCLQMMIQSYKNLQLQRQVRCGILTTWQEMNPPVIKANKTGSIIFGFAGKVHKSDLQMLLRLDLSVSRCRIAFLLRTDPSPLFSPPAAYLCNLKMNCAVKFKFQQRLQADLWHTALRSPRREPAQTGKQHVLWLIPCFE